MKAGIQKFNKEECNKENPNFQRVKASKGDCRECQSCGGCFSRRIVFRHQRQCQKDGLVPPKPRDLLQCQSDVSPAFLELLDSLHFDEVGNFCRKDTLVKLLGNRLFMAEKSKVDKTNEVKRSVRASMRMLTRLYFEIRKVFQLIKQEECENIEDMFMRENFHVLTRAVDKIT